MLSQNDLKQNRHQTSKQVTKGKMFYREQTGSWTRERDGMTWEGLRGAKAQKRRSTWHICVERPTYLDSGESRTWGNRATSDKVGAGEQQSAQSSQSWGDERGRRGLQCLDSYQQGSWLFKLLIFERMFLCS